MGSEVRAEYLAKIEKRDALIRELAQRQIGDPRLFFAPDLRSLGLLARIWSLQATILALGLSDVIEDGAPLLLDCLRGEHGKCRRGGDRDGTRLMCGCGCHKSGRCDSAKA